MAFNYRQVKAIERQNKERILRTNPYVDENSGIYFLTREDENGIRYAYIGQAKNISAFQIALWTKQESLLTWFWNMQSKTECSYQNRQSTEQMI